MSPRRPRAGPAGCRRRLGAALPEARGPDPASPVGGRPAVGAGAGAGPGLGPEDATRGSTGGIRGPTRGAARDPVAAGGTGRVTTSSPGGITGLRLPRRTDPVAGPALGGGRITEGPTRSRGGAATMALVAPSTRRSTGVGGRDPGRGRGAQRRFA